MPICSICEGRASDLLCGRWFCRQCMRAVLDKPAPMPPPPRKKVSILDKSGHLIRAPFCDICQDRIATFIVFGTAICTDCSRAGREWPDKPDAVEGDLAIPEKPKRPGLGSCLVDFPDEYVCVDVETTGRSPSEDEIIEISAQHVKDGVTCDTFTSLVKPSHSHVPWTYAEIQKLGYASFNDVPRAVFEDDSGREILPSEIVDLTGITDDKLMDAPPLDAVIPQFYEFVGDHILVGHNAIFDMNFLYDACLQCGFLLKNNYIDTLRIARNLLPELTKHRLSDLARYFHIAQTRAHRAEDDVITTIGCFEQMRALVLQTQTIPEYIKGFVDLKRRSSSRSLKSIRAQKHFRPGDLVRPDDTDPSHPLYGKSIVFTGELSLARTDAAQMAADVGAQVKTAVSGKTDFLVVGQQDMSLVGSSGVSGKERKAHDLNASGKGHIRILTEQEFIELASLKTGAGEL